MYATKGYNQIENEINSKLSSGQTYAADVFNAPPETKAAELKLIPTFVANNLDAFDIRKESGATSPMTEKEVAGIEELFAKGEPRVSISVNRETDPTLILRAPIGEKFQLKMNIAKMGTDVAERLVMMTGRPEILDVLFKDIKFANKTYTLDDKYLKNIISQRYKDTTPFEGLSITQDNNDGMITYTVAHPVLSEIFGTDVQTFKSKFGMMKTLDEINYEYTVNNSK
jgi:hypothetical protein